MYHFLIAICHIFTISTFYRFFQIPKFKCNSMFSQILHCQKKKKTENATNYCARQPQCFMNIGTGVDIVYVNHYNY